MMVFVVILAVETRLIASLPIVASEMGTIAQQLWFEIPARFPFVELGNFVVMPNHIHGILILNKPEIGDGIVDVDGNVDGNVEMRLIASLQSKSPPQSKLQPQPNQPKTGGFAGNKNPMVNENVSRIIRWYKGRCTFEMRKIHADFEWQSRFHDHVIRNHAEYQRISEYIVNNPANWHNDKFFTE
jgi:REP element-mobilizing transposase RayT